MSTAQRRLLRRPVALLVAALVVAACGSSAARPTVDTNPVNPIRPRVTATPGAEATAIASFIEFISADDVSYRVAFKGGVGLSTAQLPIEGRTDVAGMDFATTFTYDFSEEYSDLPDPIKVAVRGVDGKGYMRRNSGSWATIKVGGDGQTTTAFWAVTDARSVRFLGVEERASGTFYRISVPDAVLIHPVTIPFMIWSEKVRRTTLEVLIDEAGRPAIGTWTAENQARVGDSGQLQGIDYELRLTFSKLGDTFDISAP